MLDVDRLLSELTLAEKASLTSGSAFWYTDAGGAAGHPQDHGLGRAARPAGPARGRRPRRPGRLGAGDLLPHRLGDRLRLEPRAAAPDRPGAGAGGPGDATCR